MLVEKNLKVTIKFYKKQCLLVIKRNKKHLSNQAVPITNALEKRSLAAAILLKVCESCVLGWSKKDKENTLVCITFFVFPNRERPNTVHQK